MNNEEAQKKTFPGRKSRRKGPEAGMFLAGFRSNKEARASVD